MKERPILFNGDMVRAILRGQKTQTRRPVMPQPFRTPPGTLHGWEWEGHGKRDIWIAELHLKHCPFGQPGDRLWVRETFAELPELDGPLFPTDVEDMLRGTHFRWTVKWTPSIHMPRRLARIFLEITEVRAEHVQDITEEDAWAEGTEGLENNWSAADLCATAKRYDLCVEDARCTYAYLWDTLYAARGLGWDANPWVWVVSFKKLEEH